MSVHSSAYFWNGDTLVLHIFLQPSFTKWVGRPTQRADTSSCYSGTRR